MSGRRLPAASQRDLSVAVDCRCTGTAHVLVVRWCARERKLLPQCKVSVSATMRAIISLRSSRCARWTCCQAEQLMVTQRAEQPRACIECIDSRGKLCSGDGDCFMRGADRETASGVRPAWDRSSAREPGAKCISNPRWSQARAACRCQPRRWLLGWAPASSGAGQEGLEASQAGTWQPCAARWLAAYAAATTAVEPLA